MSKNIRNEKIKLYSTDAHDVSRIRWTLFQALLGKVNGQRVISGGHSYWLTLYIGRRKIRLPSHKKSTTPNPPNGRVNGLNRIIRNGASTRECQEGEENIFLPLRIKRAPQEWQAYWSPMRRTTRVQNERIRCTTSDKGLSIGLYSPTILKRSSIFGRIPHTRRRCAT